MIFKRFLKENRAFATVEFAFVSIAMVAIILFSMDTGMYIMEKNKMERVNYSLITIVRERGRLYDDNEEVTQAETNDLGTIAARLIGTTLADNVKIRVDALYFSENSTKANAVIEKSLSFVSQRTSKLTDAECFSKLSPVSTLQDHTVWADGSGWLPIFRVSVCAPNRNKTPMPYFDYSNDIPSLFITSSIGIIR